MKAIGLILLGIVLFGACKPEHIDAPTAAATNTEFTQSGQAATTTATTPGSTATISGTTTTSATGINSLAAIEQDQDSNGEALPFGMPTNFGWRLHGWIPTGVPGGNNPGNAPAIFPWFVIYPTGGPSQAVNTRVQVRNVYIYYLSKGTNSWILATGANTAGGYYNSFDTDTNYYSMMVDKRNETAANGGGTSIKMAAGGFPFQGWCAAGPGAVDSTDVAGVWAYCEARLILDNPAGTDDRSVANLVLCPGGDYKDLSSNTIGAIGIGRFKRVTNDWRAFNMSTLTYAQWASAPPPPVNLFD